MHILVICLGLVLATNAFPFDNNGIVPSERDVDHPANIEVEATRTEYPDLKTALMDILSTKDFIEIIQNSVNFTAPSQYVCMQTVNKHVFINVLYNSSLQLRSQQSTCNKIGAAYGGNGGGAFDDQIFCGQQINSIRVDQAKCSGGPVVVSKLDIGYV